MVTDIEKLTFLQSFSEMDYLLNEHKKEHYLYILDIYNKILPFILDGNFIDLGCGTGMVAKFCYKYSGKEIIPHGIDSNDKSIYLAKNNNPIHRNNFEIGNYFDISTINFSKFSTVISNLSKINTMERVVDYKNLINHIYTSCVNANIVVYSPDGFFEQESIFALVLTKFLIKKFVPVYMYKNFLVIKK